MSSQKSEISCESRKLKKPGVSILNEILRHIKLDPDVVLANNAILHAFLNTFVAEMKSKDELFKSLYNAPFFTGSFYSDLRVSQPDEFDINLIFKLPFKDSDFEVTHQFQTPSYVKYRLKNYQEALIQHPTLMKALFEDGFLIPEKVRVWLQSVVARAMINYKPPNQCLGVRTKQAGPARTILLQTRRGQIDIDLVPVISCTLDLPKVNLDGRVSAKVGSQLKAFLVPKPYSNTSRQMPVNKKEVRCLWRSHFPEAEEKIIKNMGCAKPIIKLLKLMRDKEDWKILASYYLKTVVMWMIIENAHKVDYWKEDKKDERFIEALNKLSTCVKQEKITYFFNKKYNLIEKMNTQQAQNLHNRLTYWIRKIEEDPNQLWNAFHMKASFINS